MKKKNYKYYILYKINTENSDQSNDFIIDYEAEFTTYAQIKEYLKCASRDIKKMLNASIDCENNAIKTFKNYFIVLE